MTGIDAVTWIGTGITIIGTGVAIWQACQAKSAAERAEEMRDEIANRSAHSELSGLNGLLVAAIRVMDKYGPGTGPEVRRGCSPASDAAAVRALTGEMARLRSLLVEKLGGEVNDIIPKINALLVDFARATNVAERDQRGGDIYNEIVELSGNIRKELDGNIFK